jgi:LemA protein
MLVWGAWTFNRLVALRNRLREAWSGIDVQLKRRHSLVPTLVACVEGYRGHERALFERVAQARAAAQCAHGAEQVRAAENELARGLRQLVVLAEAYPQLKAAESYLALGRQLVEIEDQIQYARRYYNGSAAILNNAIESFPSLLIARVFGFKRVEFWEVESALDRAAPEVRL